MEGSPVGGGSVKKQPTIRPTEYRCFIKEVNPFMAQRVRKPHRGKISFVLRATPRPDGT